MKNSLVTVFGGSGFLGRHVVRALAKEGYRVRVAVRHPHLAQYLPPMGKVGQIQVSRVDVLDAEQVATALHGAEAAVNLVGILHPGGGQSFAAAHIDAPANIARASRSAGLASVVHVSALGADRKSESAYARSKAEGERALRAEFSEAAILRPSLVFGPEDDFFNKFAALARFAPALPLIGGAHTKFQPVFVGDVAAAVVKCVEDKTTQGKTYELGGPTVYSFKQILQLVLRETGRRRLLVPLPFFLASLNAVVLQFLPGKLLTPDQVKLLHTDNVVSPGALALGDLGIVPDSLEAVLPSYLWRFRTRGQYEEQAKEEVTGAP